MINKPTIDHLLCGSSLLSEISYKKDRSVGFEKKNSDQRKRLIFFKGHQKHRSFSWPYVEPPTKSATASQMMMLLNLKLLKLLKKMTTGHLILQKYQKQNSWLYYNPSKE